jgi:predicted site-specific integrase-resolvase
VKAAVYARCATSERNEDRIGSQILVCEQLAERYGFTIVKRFSDRNLSGLTARRPAYQEMLLAARQHEFDAIIAEDISRFWRGSEMFSLLAEMDSLGITVLTEHFDSRDETSKIALPLLNPIGDSSVHALRVKRGIERQRTKRMEDNQ